MTFQQLTQELNKEVEPLQNDVGIYIKFLNSGEIYEKNSDTQFWAASTIKIPIALEFYKKIIDENISEDKRTKIEPENYVLGSGITKLLNKNNTYTYKDLLTLMLIASDNSAANQLVDFIGWESVENYMQACGLKNTTYRHKMMIKAGRGPNLTTPKDMGILLEKMYNAQLPGSWDVLNVMKEHIDRTRIPLYIPNDVEIAHKNGSLEKAVHAVGVIFAKNPFVFCFFSDEQEDKRKTNEILSECAKLCFEYSKGN